MPESQEAPQTPEAVVDPTPLRNAEAILNAPMGGNLLQRIPRALSAQTALNRQSAELETARQNKESTAQAEALRTYRGAQEEAMRPLNEQGPPPAFVPTPETAQDLGTLFSMLALAGSALGGKAKSAGTIAMSSMIGMMNGYRQGRMDLYERDRKNFESSLQQYRAQREHLQGIMERNLQLAQTNLQEANVRAHAEFIAAGAPILANTVMSQGISSAVQQWQQISQLQERAAERASRLQEAAERRRFEEAQQGRAFEQQRTLAEAQARREEARLTLQNNQRLDTWLRGQGPESMYLFHETNQPVAKEAAQRIVKAAQTIGEGLAIIDEVNRLPQNIGRSGQVRSLFEKYFESISGANPSGAPPVQAPTSLTDDEQRQLRNDRGAQDALLFAKRYAAYLVNYERALAGGSRGFTVQFQRRFNDLMAQEQFTPRGLTDLLSAHLQEIANGAVQPGLPQINFDRLSHMGVQLYDQSAGPGRAGEAQRGLNLISGRQPTAASPPPLPSTVPPNSSWSPSRQQWRDQSGRFYNEKGEPQ